MTAFLMAAVLVIQTFLFYLPFGTVHAEEEGMALGPYVNSTTITYMDNGSEVTPEVIDGVYQIPDGADVRLCYHYEIPQGMLSEDHHTFTLHAPDSFKITQAESGDIMNGDTIQGTFSISTDGTVILDYNPDAIKMDQDGPLTDGIICINGQIDINKRDEKGEVPLNVEGSSSPEIRVHIKPTLNVSKTATQTAGSRDVQYSITVDAPIGTDNEPVTLTDTVDPDEYGSINLDSPENISVTTSTGQIIPESEIKVENEGEGKTVLTLPPLKTGESYTINYDSKIRVTNGKEVSAKNTAIATTTPDVTSEPSSASVAYTPTDLIKKVGYAKDGTDYWTITVNPDHDDIGKWTLSDVWSQPLISSTPLGKTVEISPAVEGKTKITLPYTFPPGCTESYKITYTTDEGNTKTTNKAILSPPDHGPEAESTASAGKEVGEEDLNKTFISAKKEGDHLILTWNLHIRIWEEDELYILKDDLNGDQYFTENQLIDIQNNLDKILQDYGISASDIDLLANTNSEGYIPFSELESTGQYTGFTVLISGSLPIGSVIDIDCSSTADYDPYADKTYENSLHLLHRDSTATYHSKTVYPSIHKFDLNDENMKDQTEHNYDDDQGPAWGIQLDYNSADGYPLEPVTVTDTMPDGLDISHLKIMYTDSDQNSGWQAVSEEAMKYIQLTEKAATKTSPASWIAVIDPGLYKEYPNMNGLLFELKTDYAKDLKWDFLNGKAQKEFLNTSVLTTENNKTLGKASQKQIIKRTVENYSGLKKEVTGQQGSDGSFSNNVIPYSITVNPKGKMLVDDGVPLTVTDVLDVSSQGSSHVNPEMVNGSLAVYEIHDGKEIPLPASDYSYTLSSRPTGDGNTQTSMVFTIPDGMEVRIDYSILFCGSIGAEAKVSNTATMNAASEGKSESESPTTLKVASASATIESGGVTVRKSDSENYSITLPGAVFEVYRYNENTGAFDPVEENGKILTWTTGEDGQVFIPIAELSYNTAYEIEEVKAPDNYQGDNKRIGFILTDGQNDDGPFTAPKDFTNHAYIFSICGQLSIGNSKTLTSIPVQKTWLNENGEKADPAVSEIEAGIYAEMDGHEYLVRKITLSDRNGWKENVTGLPLYEDNNPEKPKIQYSVKELTTSGSWKSETKTAEDGSVEIVNTLNTEKIALPVTGKPSVWILPSGGILLVAAGSVLKAKIRRKDPLRNK